MGNNKEIDTGDRTISSPYYGLQVCGDILIYPVKEENTCYMKGINIKNFEQEFKILLPSNVAGFSAYDDIFLWTVSFSGLETSNAYFYNINDNHFYLFNGNNDSIFVPRVANQHVVWRHNDADNNLIILNTDTWEKHEISDNVSGGGNPFISQDGEIYTVSFNTGICGIYK